MWIQWNSKCREEKATGKSHKITIKNDKGRLTQEDMERMVSDAEKFKEEDEKLKAKVDAKNDLESYCFHVKNSIEEEKIKSVIEEDAIQQIKNKVEETMQQINEMLEAPEVEVSAKLKQELESIVNPIMEKIYSQQVERPGSKPGEENKGAGSGAGADAGAGMSGADAQEFMKNANRQDPGISIESRLTKIYKGYIIIYLND